MTREAIVLAGGFGTRLRGVVSDVPKPMAPIGDEPFLALILRRLAQQGFGRVVLSVGYLADIIVAFFGPSHLGMEIIYCREDTALGTGGAIRSGLASIAGDHAYIFNGDTYLNIDVAALAAQWSASANPIIVGRQVADTARYGRLDVTDGRIVGFGRRAEGAGLINGGLYVLPVDLFAGFDQPAPFSFETDFLPDAVGRRRFEVHASDDYFIDIGVPEDYARAQSELRALLA